MHVTDDDVLETSTTTGTGPLTLTATLTGYNRLNSARRADGSAIQVGDTVPYVAWGVDPVTFKRTGERENGIGTYSATNVLTRTTVLGSSNANAAVSFTAALLWVTIGALARKVLQSDPVGAILLNAASAEPPTPPTGSVYIYQREIVPGYDPLKVKRPSGVDTPLQDDLGFNGLAKWVGSNNAIAAFGAGALTTVGTLSAVTPASGTAANALPRMQIASAATAGALASAYANNAGLRPVMRGGQLGEGGLRVINRVRLSLMQAGQRGFFGLADVVTAPTNVDPTTSTTPGKIGLAFNLNTGNWNLVHNITGSAPTVIALGANFPLDITSLMELVLFCRPYNGTAGNVTYRVRRYTTASDVPAFEATGTLSTNLPAATTLLHVSDWMTNNATAAAVQWHFGSVSVQASW